MPEVIKNYWTHVFGLVGPLAYFSVYALWIPILLLVLANVPRLVTIFRMDGAVSLGKYLPYFVLPAFGALSATWALIPSDTISTALKFSGYFCTAILAGLIIRQATEDERRKIVLSTAIGFLVAFPIVLLDVSLSGGVSSLYKSYEFNPNMYSRGTAITACLLFPLAVGLFRYTRPMHAIPFVLICIGMIFGLYMEAAKLAVILGALIFGLIRWQQKLFWPVVLLPLLIALTFPAFFKASLSVQQQCQLHDFMDSAYHRIMIYQFSTSRILEKPILGWGMDSSRSIPGGAEKAITIVCKQPNDRLDVLNIGGKLPLHPHNAAIQIWLELGLFGALLLLGTVFLIVRRFEKLSGENQGRAMIAATFCSICLIYNISFGLWQSWLMFAMILLGCFVVSLQRGPEPSGDP
ncbi:MAG: hypothetical protein GKS01_19160 [Alphaproteobacteria bacterium]|nr:hypothetical protein [Alphaproteobacteria bacterium]